MLLTTDSDQQAMTV